MPAPTTNARRHENSMAGALGRIEHDSHHHLTGSFVHDAPSPPAHPPQDPISKTKRAKPKQKVAFTLPDDSQSVGIWEELRTMRWMRVPASSAKLVALPVLLWLSWHFLWPHLANPLAHVLFISGRVPGTPDDDPRYQKTYWDLLFMAYYIVVFSFVRQSLFIYVLRPLAKRLGLRKEGKVDRFAEQGYAILYWGTFACLGIYVMRGLPTWWYRTEHFWIGYPHWDMKPLMKTYYLLQTSYWVHQLMVLVLRIEKPRKDFQELFIHHLVTLWLIGWSYLINLTLIGNAIFITMDLSDTFFALAKTLNYLKFDKFAMVAFLWFICVWTYMRHYLNLKILWSVWTQFDLIAPENRQWDPPRGVWLVWWMKYQVFVPIVLLQMVNLFWYFLIWRVLYRAVFTSGLADERSDDEDEPESPVVAKVSKED